MKCKELAKENFAAETSTGIVLVDFWAPWCNNCRMIAPFMDDLASKYDGKATIVKLNADEADEILGQYNIMSLPTVLILKDGTEISRLTGVMAQSRFEAELNKVI